MRITLLGIVACLTLSFSIDSQADAKRDGRRHESASNHRMNSSAGAAGQKALSVKGQARSLSMMMVLKNKQDAIDFIKAKRNFREEILNTNY